MLKWLFEFPIKANFDNSIIDNFIRTWKNAWRGFFDAIKKFLNEMVWGIQDLLSYIPWLVFFIVVFFVGFKLEKKLRKGILYVLLLAFVAYFGLWDLMLLTLAIVLAAVIISCLFGFPLGILVSRSERLNKIVRPILDTMQTMPIFVYLIPSIIFFGLGEAPAVIATTIYAIVPLIRLTNHGIRMVNEEVVEASRAFGATELQTLIKVQIPQALPTIMTGLNQTLMMAMSMVVTTSMIGANGLGMEVLLGVQRMELGRGLIAGIAVVILAILLDRFTQNLVKKEEGVINE
ncbi:MAG TPA: ABC transporter permease subunit [Acholeplasmataceae bacterium]|nr:ABC transporter permease subunit [Acholeplasmataceae bacterium]